MEKKLRSFIYQNAGFGENILSVADISQRYQSGNYQLQLLKYDLQIKIVVFAKESIFGG